MSSLVPNQLAPNTAAPNGFVSARARSAVPNSFAPNAFVPNGPGLAPILPLYLLSGSATGRYGQRAFVVTLTPVVATLVGTDTVTFSDSGAGGSFVPPSVTITSASEAQDVSYLPSSSGNFSITASSAASYQVRGGPVLIDVTAETYPNAELGQLATGLPAAYVDKTGSLVYFLTQADNGGSGAVATANLSGTTVGSIGITSGGSGYSATHPPSVFLVGGGGTSATAKATVSGGIVAGITVTNPGRGYTSAPTVVISAVSPSYVTAVNSNPTIYLNGIAQACPLCVSSIPLAAGGSSWTKAPVVAITAASGDTTGFGATATASISSGGGVTAINVVCSGINYTLPPTVTLTRASGDTTGTGATAGTPVLGPFWTSKHFEEPWVAYWLPTPALSTDVLTFSASAGWLATAAGSIGASTSAPITNSVGQLEPVPSGWGYCPFGTNYGTLGMGQNIAWPNSTWSAEYYQPRNWMHRLSRIWSSGSAANAVSLDDSGHPTAIVASNGIANQLMLSWTANVQNNQGYTTTNGIYTFIATEGGANPMLVTLIGNAFATVTPILVPTGTGTKVWTWSVESPAQFGKYDAVLTLQVQTYNGAAGPWTLADEWFLPPLSFVPAPVGNVLVTAYGSGYRAPTATLAGGGGTGATLTVGALANGAVISATVTSGGSGYTSVPTITPSGGGGSGFAAYAIILGGVVTHVVVSNCGSGYASAPTLAFSASGGSGAAATASAPVNGVITSISVATAGTGYTSSPAVTISDATGSGATAWALLQAPAQSTTVADAAAPDPNVIARLTTPTGKTPTMCRLIDAVMGFDGETNSVDADDLLQLSDWSWNDYRYPTATATVSGGQVTAMTLTFEGQDLTSAPTVAFVGGTTGTVATATAVISGGSITGFTGLPSGSGYTTAPTVYLVGGYTGNKTRTLEVTQLAEYVPSKVFVSDNWPGTVASGVGDPLPWYWATSSINFLNAYYTGSVNTPVYVAEATTSAPHGLKTGQRISWTGTTSGPVTVAAAGGNTVTVPVTAFNNLPVYVTGPSTFAWWWSNSGLDLGFGPANVTNGPIACNLYANIIVPDGGTIPYEIVGDLTNYLPGGGIHVNIPFNATIACVQAIAARILSKCSTTALIEVELSNEHWDNTWPRNNVLWSYGYLYGAWANSAILDNMYTQRAGDVHAAFYGVFAAAGRGNQVIRQFGSFWASSAVTTNMCTYAAANNIQMDVIQVAPYPGVPYDGPFVSAGALIATYSTNSLLSGATISWTRPMMASLLRHHAKYNSTNPNWGLHAAAIVAHYTGSGAPATAFGKYPIMACYENALTTIIPSGIENIASDVNSISLRSQLTTDLRYDPSIYSVEHALYEAVQDGGAAYCIRYNFCGPNSSTPQEYDGAASINYPLYTWVGQPWGTGDGSDGKPVNQFSAPSFTVSHDYQNVSVMGQAWRDWADAANTALLPRLASNTTTNCRWFPKLQRPVARL